MHHFSQLHTTTMTMMSAPSSSFHDYLAMDYTSLKTELMSPVANYNNSNHLKESFNSNSSRTSRNSIVKRPMNAFLLWARGERKRVSSDGCGVSQTSLSKVLGETWRHMPVEEKQPFLDMAETLKRQHHIDHPDYKFKPKQRSPTTTTTTTKTDSGKKNPPLTIHRQLSTMNSSSRSPSPSILSHSNSSLSPISNVTPHPIQPAVLAMCQAIIPTVQNSSSSSGYSHDWFSQLTGSTQSVIVAPTPRIQTSPFSSRRAVRIQIINKHDDIILPPPTLLPMTPPPPPPPASVICSMAIDDSTPTLADYLANTCAMFNIPTSNYQAQQVLAPVMEDSTGYDTLPDPSANHLTDLDHHYDGSGWIDTPLSNFGSNPADMASSSPYTSYDFLCL